MDTNFKLIISTSNKWWHQENNVEKFIEKIYVATQNQFSVQIYSTANRVDEMDLCRTAAEVLRYPAPIAMKADWSQHGQKALYLRNNELVSLVDAAIIFWDQKTKSEQDLFNLCKTKNKPCKLYKFDIDLNRR